jgi:hypothetical protein
MKGFYRGGEPGGAWAGIYDTVIDYFYSSKCIRRKEKSAAEEQSEKKVYTRP